MTRTLTVAVFHDEVHVHVHVHVHIHVHVHVFHDEVRHRATHDAQLPVRSVRSAPRLIWHPTPRPLDSAAPDARTLSSRSVGSQASTRQLITTPGCCCYQVRQMLSRAEMSSLDLVYAYDRNADGEFDRKE